MIEGCHCHDCRMYQRMAYEAHQGASWLLCLVLLMVIWVLLADVQFGQETLRDIWERAK